MATTTSIFLSIHYALLLEDLPLITTMWYATMDARLILYLLQKINNEKFANGWI